MHVHCTALRVPHTLSKTRLEVIIAMPRFMCLVLAAAAATAPSAERNSPPLRHASDQDALGVSHDAPSRTTAPRPARLWNTTGWVGAEYTPSLASSSLWWADYDLYAPAIDGELAAARTRLGFTALRMFVHFEV